MIKKIDSIIQKEIMPGFKGRFVHTKGFSIAYWDIDEGSVLPEHSHIHEQTTEVKEGKLELTIEGHTQIMEPGTIAIIPSNAVHSGKALTNCKITDVFCPVREDYK